jgi:hypothetical protein
MDTVRKLRNNYVTELDNSVPTFILLQRGTVSYPPLSAKRVNERQAILPTQNGSGRIKQ